jgi:hypothetical protein
MDYPELERGYEGVARNSEPRLARMLASVAGRFLASAYTAPAQACGRLDHQGGPFILGLGFLQNDLGGSECLEAIS